MTKDPTCDEVIDCSICAPNPCIGGAHRNAMVEDGVIVPGVRWEVTNLTPEHKIVFFKRSEDEK